MNCPRCDHKLEYFSNSLDATQDWLCTNCNSSLTVLWLDSEFITSLWIDGRENE